MRAHLCYGGGGNKRLDKSVCEHHTKFWLEASPEREREFLCESRGEIVCETAGERGRVLVCVREGERGWDMVCESGRESGER